jgi:hypothetical protein
MKRFLIATTALAMMIGVGGAAYAAATHGADGGRRHQKLVFPVSGDQFQQRIDERLAKIKDKIERKLAEKQVPADKAAAIRARFAASAARVSAATKTVTADGVVTQDEAKSVREAMRAMHPLERGDRVHRNKDKSANHEKG